MARLALSTALALGALTSAPGALADGRVGAFDWERFILDADAHARNKSEKPSLAARVERAQAGDIYLQNDGSAWFGVAPRVSFVARDWANAYRLAGDRLGLLDAVRLSQSTRMVVTRVRLSNARVAPFTQLGLGQWRVDRDLLPLTPRTTELAGQLGGGVEVQVAAWWQLAAESTLTAIYREQREPNDLPQTRMWSAMVASRFEF